MDEVFHDADTVGADFGRFIPAPSDELLERFSGCTKAMKASLHGTDRRPLH